MTPEESASQQTDDTDNPDALNADIDVDLLDHVSGGVDEMVYRDLNFTLN